MEMTSSVLGSCALAAVVVVVRIVQDRMDRRRDHQLDAIKRHSSSLAEAARKNGRLRITLEQGG